MSGCAGFWGRSEGFDLQFQLFHGTGSIFCIVGVAFAVGTVATSLSGDVSNGQTIGRDGLNRYDTQNHSRSTGAYTCGNILGERHDVWSVNTEKEYHEK